jgi:osmotically-inducible protein OsmY
VDSPTSSYLSVVTAGDIAWSAPGVEQVVNHLTIIP